MKNIFSKFFFIITFFIIYTFTFNINICKSQWVQKSNGMGISKTVQCFALKGSSILAGTFEAGIFRSTDFGESWTSINNGLTSLNVYSILISGNNIFAGVYSGGVFLSTNDGISWVQVNNGIENRTVQSIISIGTNLFVGTSAGGGVFLSTNNGGNWTAVNNGISNLNVLALTSIGNTIFAGTSGYGVFRSTNNGGNWTAVNSGFSNFLGINLFFLDGNTIYAGKNDGLFLTTNNGDNWSSLGLLNQQVGSVSKYGNIIFTGLTGGTGAIGVFLSTNNGVNWINKNQGLPNFPFTPEIYSLIIVNNYIFTGTALSSVWRRDLTEITGVNSVNKIIPTEYALFQNYPNPFNPTTNIKYQIAKSSFVSLYVYDALGREIETLVYEKQNAGIYEITFNASEYPSGVYFYRLTTESFSETKKMLLVK